MCVKEKRVKGIEKRGKKKTAIIIETGEYRNCFKEGRGTKYFLLFVILCVGEETNVFKKCKRKVWKSV